MFTTGNLSTTAINNFIEFHVCNFFCKCLNLKPLSWMLMLHYFTSLFGANTCSEQLFWLMPLLHHGDSYCTVLFLFFPSTQGNVHVEFLKVHSIQGKSLYISIGFHVVLCDFVCPIQTSPCYYIDTWQNVLLKSTSCWKWVRFSLCVSGVGDDGDMEGRWKGVELGQQCSLILLDDHHDVMCHPQNHCNWRKTTAFPLSRITHCSLGYYYILGRDTTKQILNHPAVSHSAILVSSLDHYWCSKNFLLR